MRTEFLFVLVLSNSTTGIQVMSSPESRDEPSPLMLASLNQGVTQVPWNRDPRSYPRLKSQAVVTYPPSPVITL